MVLEAGCRTLRKLNAVCKGDYVREGQELVIELAGQEWTDLAGESFQCVEELCYLGDMISTRWSWCKLSCKS